MTDEAIKTLDLKETVIKQRDDIKLVKIERKVQIANMKGTSIRYEVRYADTDKFITGIATNDEKSAIDLFDRIKN